MNGKILTAGVLLAGVMMTTGTALAVERPRMFANKPEPPKELREANGQRPPMMNQNPNDSKRPPMPPDKKHPRVSRDRRPPMPPKSQNSKDGRPPMPPEQPRGVAPR